MTLADASPDILPSEVLMRVMDELWDCIRAGRPLEAGMLPVLHDALQDMVSGVQHMEALWRAEQALRLYRLPDATSEIGSPPTRQDAVREAIRQADGNVVALPSRPREGVWHMGGGDAA